MRPHPCPALARALLFWCWVWLISGTSVCWLCGGQGVTWVMYPWDWRTGLSVTLCLSWQVHNCQSRLAVTHHQGCALISHYLLIVKSAAGMGFCGSGKGHAVVEGTFISGISRPCGSSCIPCVGLLSWLALWRWQLRGKSHHILADDEHGPPHCHFLKGLAQTRAWLKSLGFAFKITCDLTATVLKILSFIKITLNG